MSQGQESSKLQKLLENPSIKRRLDGLLDRNSPSFVSSVMTIFPMATSKSTANIIPDWEEI